MDERDNIIEWQDIQLELIGDTIIELEADNIRLREKINAFRKNCTIIECAQHEYGKLKTTETCGTDNCYWVQIEQTLEDITDNE